MVFLRLIILESSCVFCVACVLRSMDVWASVNVCVGMWRGCVCGIAVIVVTT